MSGTESTRDARLGQTTSTSEWWEVELIEDGALVRRRHVDCLTIAGRMVTTWLDGTPAIWDRVFGDTGTVDWYERKYGPLPTYR